MYDIIPDIHGQAAKLRGTLSLLGYQERNGAWRHPDLNRQCIFLGDFIDRGPKNAEVIDIVRRMIDAGSAQAVMGNHELNAIQYHSIHPETNVPLREHSLKNAKQHESFLREFPLGDAETREVIEWMKTLPLFLELDGFRAVHACWDDEHIATLRQHAEDGILAGDLVYHAADPKHLLHEAVETITKGPEHPLPEGAGFHDKDGVVRNSIRVKWWAYQPDTWQDVAISVPNPEKLLAGAPPEGVVRRGYASTAKPVFFGHYWLNGSLEMQASNALCLDYSAGRDGPLVSYRFVPGDEAIWLDRVTVPVSR
ncbi:metallophosphoesterase [Marimonas lutisalis]|uniref:metallophosphoesterase n=1 Tax=Marimonas lutisalis TaxID=2545756 RepID=UPI0010F6625B|nr:metallophosphoesterase [Marimonas lutisalis]